MGPPEGTDVKRGKDRNMGVVKDKDREVGENKK